MKDRIGRFKISREMVECYPETALAVMGRCIVVKCEMSYELDYGEYFEYKALSPYFDEVEEGGFIPEYDVVINGESIEFKRSNAKAEAREKMKAAICALKIALENMRGIIAEQGGRNSEH